MNKVVTYKQRNAILSHKKEWHFAICNNMNEVGKPYTKWKKTERQILYDITCMWHLKNLSIKQRNTQGEQTRVNKVERGKGQRQERGRGLRSTNTMYKINNLQGYIVQHKEHSQWFILTIWNNLQKPNQHALYLKLMQYCISTIFKVQPGTGKISVF